MTARTLVDSIKKKLRVKGITYAQLSQGIGVSESTVKRMFRAESDITLGRLDDICKFLGIPFSELLEKSIPPETASLTGKQEEALSKDPDMLHLFYASMTIKDSSALAKYSRRGEKTVRMALKNLENLGLLKRDLGDKLRTQFRMQLEWAPKGPLAQKFLPQMRSDFISSNFDGELEHQVLKYYLVSPESAEVIRRKLSALLHEIGELSKLDLRFARERVIPWSVYFAARPHFPKGFANSAYPSQQALKRIVPSALDDH